MPRWTTPFILLIPLTSSGCFELMMLPPIVLHQLSYVYKDVDFYVIDGETMGPIGGAKVKGETPLGGWGPRPDSDEGITDARGCVRLRICVNGGMDITVDAPGYMDVADPWTTAEVQSRHVLAIYRLPEPVSGIEVPTGYRGALQIRLRIDADRLMPPTRWPRGQRAFFTRANIDGITVIEPPPILTRWQSDRYVSVARFSDGTPLPVVQGGIIVIRGLSDSWFGPARSNLTPEDSRLLTALHPRSADSVALWQIGTTNPSVGESATFIHYVGTYAQAKAAQAQIPRSHRLFISVPSP